MNSRRVLAGVAIAACLAASVGAGLVWNEYLRAPAAQPLPLPAGLVSLHSPEGQRLLAESHAVADYDGLRIHFVPQSRKAYCSVASALTTLNAARIPATPLDQRRLFDREGVDVHPLKVSFIGMSLRELGEVLRAHGADATVVPASSSDAEAFRELVRANLAREGDYVLVNYGREHLGQQKMGHISPLAAYHEASDRVLVLDVAAHKYPPVWVPLEKMWQAMHAPLNAETTVTRGFIVVAAPSRRTALADAGD